MNKTEFVGAVAEKAGLSKKDVANVVNTALELVGDTLVKGDKVVFTGFGSFEVRDRAAREGRDPRNPDRTIHIPAKKLPAFKAGKELKAKVEK